MRAGLGLLFVLLLAASPAQAQDGTLRPDTPTVFGGPTVAYLAFLSDVFDAYTVFGESAGPCWAGVQMIQVASFTPERSVGVCRTSRGFSAYSVIPERNLWYTGLDSTCGERWCSDGARTVRLETRRADIDAETAGCVTSAWDTAVRTARYVPRTEITTVGLDGETSYFASRSGGVEVTASVWSPAPATLAGALVSLGEQVGAFARGEATPETLGRACSRVEALLPAETNP